MSLSPYMLSQVLAAIAFSIMLAGMIALTLQLLTLRFPNLNRCTCWLQDKNIHALLQKLGILEKGTGHTNKYSQSTLNGHVVSRFTVRMLLTSVFFMATMTVGVFVEKLLLKVTHLCEPEMECFLTENHFADSYTLTNCSDISVDTRVTCYKFQFDLFTALAAAGGLIIISKATINILNLVLSQVIQRSFSCYCCCVLPLIILLGSTFMALIAVMAYTPSVQRVIAINGSLLVIIQCAAFFNGIVSVAIGMVFLREPKPLKEHKGRQLLDPHAYSFDGQEES